MRYDSSLERPANWERFLNWVRSSLKDPDSFDKIDWETEVDRRLTCSEAVELVLADHPGLWRDDALQDHYNRAKRIVIIEPLIEKIATGVISASYRRRPKYGYYYVVENRFKPKRGPRLLLEFYRTEKVDPQKLSDEEARLAGVESSEELRRLFRRWYGETPGLMYRNWFRLVQ